MLSFIITGQHTSAILEITHAHMVSTLLSIPFAYMIISGCIQQMRPTKVRP